MDYLLSDQIEKVSGIENSKLNSLLESLCTKGLVMDFWIGDRYYYMPSPFVIGIFEFTMMRIGDNLDTKKWAKLFFEYMNDEKSICCEFWKRTADFSAKDHAARRDYT